MRLIQAGPRGAAVMLVGEAPSVTELTTGQPFTGGAGYLLSQSLSRAGISMSSCFQTNVLHVPLPGKTFDSVMKGAAQAHLVQGMLQLKADIESIRPNIVVPLGAGALQVVTGKKGIDKWRGSILQSALVKGQKCVATYSPGFALKVYEAKAIMEIDFSRVLAESQTPEIKLPEREYFLAPDAETQARLVHEMYGAEWLSVDIECWQDDSGKWRLACVGFSDRQDRCLVIPATSAGNLLDIRTLVESPLSKKIYQNGQFDVSVLQDEGFNPVNYAWDTMYAHYSLFNEAASGEDELTHIHGKKKRVNPLRKGLAFQTSIYTREPYYKEDGKLWKETNDLQLFYLYNGKDSAVTHEIKNVQEKELDEFGTRTAFERIMRVTPALMSATRRGILIDKKRREELKQMYMFEIDNLQKFLDTSAGTPINVKSTPQVTKFLYEQLKLPAKYSKKTGNLTADKDAINDLAGKFPGNPLLQVVLKIRERRDYLERYIDIALGPDGRMRCLFDPSGTKSGRLASRTSLDGTGTNLQTIPARKAIGELIKQMFVADLGKIFIYPDFKQAEAWLVAYLARCEGLIELLNDPTRDVHYENASRIYNKPVAQVTEEERYLAKRVVHASNYGMGPDKLVMLVAQETEATGIRISFKQAKELMEKYFMIYPEIKTVFWRGVEQEVQYSRTLSTPLGQKRAFFGRWNDELLRDAYSWIPQATVGHLGLEATANIYENVQLGRPELGAEFLLNVHDSVLVQCNEEHFEATADAVLANMRIPITVYGREFIIPTDCKIGKNWGKRSDSNPAGMRDISKGTDGL